MKRLFFSILIFCASLIFFVGSSATCYLTTTTTTTVPTTFIIKNLVSSATISSIKWSEFSLNNSLLPGQSSTKFRIYDYEFEKVSSYSGVIKFNLSAKNSVVYLETVDSYSIIKNEQKTFVIDDNTKVKNPILSENSTGNNFQQIKTSTIADYLR